MISEPVLTVVRKVKESLHEANTDGIPPIVVLCKDGKPSVAIVAQDGNKEAGLKCLYMCHRLLDFDTATLAVDARMKVIKLPEGSDTSEMTDADDDDDYEYGDFQKAAAEGLGEQLGIREVIVMHEVSDAGICAAGMLEYKTSGTSLEWVSAPEIEECFNHNEPKIAGTVPYMMMQILDQPSERRSIIRHGLEAEAGYAVSEEQVDEAGEEFNSAVFKNLCDNGYWVLDTDKILGN